MLDMVVTRERTRTTGGLRWLLLSHPVGINLLLAGCCHHPHSILDAGLHQQQQGSIIWEPLANNLHLNLKVREIIVFVWGKTYNGAFLGICEGAETFFDP
jgi:hypothetical protein